MKFFVLIGFALLGITSQKVFGIEPTDNFVLETNPPQKNPVVVPDTSSPLQDPDKPQDVQPSVQQPLQPQDMLPDLADTPVSQGAPRSAVPLELPDGFTKQALDAVVSLVQEAFTIVDYFPFNNWDQWKNRAPFYFLSNAIKDGVTNSINIALDLRNKPISFIEADVIGEWRQLDKLTPTQRNKVMAKIKPKLQKIVDDKAKKDKQAQVPPPPLSQDEEANYERNFLNAAAHLQV